MKHRIAGNKLSRNSSLRKATLRDIARAILVHERVCTTKAKAKEARKLIDRLITMGKKGTLAHKRKAFSVLCDHTIVKNLFDTIAPRFKSRMGGYTRIILAGQRSGDNAIMAYLELTEKSQMIVSKSKALNRAKEKELKAQEGGKAQEKPSAEKSEKEPKVAPQEKHSSASQTKNAAEPKIKKLGGLGKIFHRKTES